jgi:uncharacterized protein (TIGR03066 family)
MLRSLIGALVVLALAGFTTALGQEKIDGKKLVGKWEPTELPGAMMVLEFTNAGKVSLVVEKGGKTKKAEGTYKLEGNKLEMALKADGTEQKETITIITLTDEEFVGKDSKDKQEKFKRVNPKK